MLKKTRRFLAVVFFALITLMLLDFTGTLHTWLGWMAKVQFLPAVLAVNVVVIAILVLLSLVFGRIYCSVICPLGVFQDIVSWVHGKRKKNRFSYSPAVSWLRYLMLAVMVVAIIVGIGALVALLAPYSTFGRIAQNLLQPLWMLGNNILAGIAERMDSYTFYHVDVWIKSITTFVIAIASFLIIGYLAWRHGRTWCNTICPVGTVLGFFARFSWFKVRFNDDKCKQCGLCSKNCKAACIDYKTMTVDYSRCVVCGNCVDKCSFGALTYAPGPMVTTKKKKEDVAAELKQDDGVGEGRRAFLLATAAAATTVLAQEKKKVDGGLAVIEEKVAPERQTPITPPGSWSANNMARRCTACQLCVSKCPNQVLRPSSELSTLMQPVMSYERGYCRPECVTCSEVCPTGAIQPITQAEKSAIQIGHAVPIHKNCVAITDGVDCGNCARHCPTGAIEMVPSDPEDEESVTVPVVNEEKCIGCGACENLCPARPFSAIFVEGHEAHRTI
ncbi:MAG: 4Fe-4S binding protein [Prevotella sp.]|nr:4Fe-4S binding protein [Prevotella sp.]